MSLSLDEVRRITDIVGEFTRFARLPAPRPAPMDLVKAAEDVAHLHAASSVPIEVRTEPTPEIVADRDQIVQALTNLVLNAVDAVKSSTDPRVLVCVAPAEPGWVRLSVSDNGPGIRPKDQELIFEKFRQGGNTLTEKPQGTGLGLPICRHIISHFGGKLWVKSEPGHGATFTVYLPTGAGAEAPRASEPSPPSPRRCGRVLVMDDEVRRLIGCKADSAAIKQAAIAKGMIMLKEEAAEKIFAGITTTEEVMRMTQQEVEV